MGESRHTRCVCVFSDLWHFQHLESVENLSKKPEIPLKSLLLPLAISLALAGCVSNPTVPVDLFSGELSNQQVATLLPLPAQVGSALLRVDGAAPGSCFTNCSFYRPVRVLPGTRKVVLEVHMPPGQSQVPIVPPERLEQATQLITNRSSLLVNSAVLDAEIKFEAGKTYQLAFGFKSKEDLSPYVWWEVNPSK